MGRVDLRKRTSLDCGRMSARCRYCCKSRMGTRLTKQWNQNYGCSESKLRYCSLRRFNLARQDPQNTFATLSAKSRRPTSRLRAFRHPLGKCKRSVSGNWYDMPAWVRPAFRAVARPEVFSSESIAERLCSSHAIGKRHLRRNSLYRGEVGICLLAAELCKPCAARMPLFEVG